MGLKLLFVYFYMVLIMYFCKFFFFYIKLLVLNLRFYFIYMSMFILENLSRELGWKFKMMVMVIYLLEEMRIIEFIV